MNTIKASSVALAAAAIGALGFHTAYHLIFQVPTPDSTDESSPAMMASTGIIVVKKSKDDNAAKYFQVAADIAEDGTSGTLKIVKPGHSLHDLVELDHLTVIGEAISLGELLETDFDGAVAMLNFDADVEINKAAA